MSTSTLQLLAPINGAPAEGSAVDLRWTGPADAESYRVQIARDADFQSVLIDTQVPATDSLTVLELLPENGAEFFWRIQPQTQGHAESWSPIASFKSASDLAVQAFKGALTKTFSPAAPAVVPIPANADGIVPPYATGTSTSGEALAIVAMMLLTSVVLGAVLFAIMA